MRTLNASMPQFNPRAFYFWIHPSIWPCRENPTWSPAPYQLAEQSFHVNNLQIPPEFGHFSNMSSRRSNADPYLYPMIISGTIIFAILLENLRMRVHERP